jgi:hypothetical protein
VKEAVYRREEVCEHHPDEADDEVHTMLGCCDV